MSSSLFFDVLCYSFDLLSRSTFQSCEKKRRLIRNAAAEDPIFLLSMIANQRSARYVAACIVAKAWIFQLNISTADELGF